MFRFSVGLAEEDVKKLDDLAERYNHKRARMAGYIILKYLKEHAATTGTPLEPLDGEIQMRLRLTEDDARKGLKQTSSRAT